MKVLRNITNCLGPGILLKICEKWQRQSI